MCGTDSTWMTPRMIFSSGRVNWDKDCPNYRTYSICWHIVAVAEQNGILQKFVKWHRKNKGGTNLTALANVWNGKKSTTANKRRKGSANILRVLRLCELETITSRFANTSANHPKPARPTPGFGTFSIGNLMVVSRCLNLENRFLLSLNIWSSLAWQRDTTDRMVCWLCHWRPWIFITTWIQFVWRRKMLSSCQAWFKYQTTWSHSSNSLILEHYEIN
jgi:hypothetical protein